MSKWNVYHKDGSFLTDVNGEQITVGGLEYSDSWMGECFVTIDFKNDSPINFEIGDYIIYRGETFELNYDPGKDKCAKRGSYGEGFSYESVKFCALQDELDRAEFLDVVLSDNKLHYTSLPKFAFYVETIDDLLDRIQANLDEQIGNGVWKVYSRNKKRSMQRGCSQDEWDTVYGEGTNDDGEFDSMSVTVDSQTCWEALALVNQKWDINFIVRNRCVYVGTAGVMTQNIFKYGLGKGLYEVDQNADSDQSIITRLRAYGSEKNLPDHYYADLGIKYKANITKVFTASSYVEFMLDLDYIDTYFKNQRKYTVDGVSGEQTSGWVLKVTFDYKTFITGYVSKGENDKCKFYSQLKGTQVDNGEEESKEALSAFINQLKADNTLLYISEGINKKTIPYENKEYAENLPNNMSINRLMLPGFPHVSLSDFYDSLTEDEKKFVNPSGKEHKLSTDKYRPYIDSVNLEKIGLRSASQFFDTDDKTNGVIEIYPTIEEMVIGNVRVDEIYTGSNIEDNGRFEDGESVKNFDIYLNPAIDFDINELRNDDFAINMKDGMCGGRTFNVASATKIEGNWRLTLERAKDDSLSLYFPYNDYQINKGDHFVLTGIELPESYIRAASLKLLKYAIALLDKNDYTRYVYQPKVDEIFMARQHDDAMEDKTGVTKSLHDTLKAGDIMQFEDKDLRIDAQITIDQLTIKENEDSIPTYEVTLREEKEVGTIEKIQQQISSLENGNGGSGGGATIAQVKSQIASEGEKYFLSKLNDDTAKGTITFEQVQKFLQGLTAEQSSLFKNGAVFGDFIPNILIGTGARIDDRGNAEFESITSRSSIVTKEIITNRQTAIESNFFATESGLVESVSENPSTTGDGSTTYVLQLQKRWEGDFTAFKEQDCIRGSVNTLMEDGKYYDMWFRVLSVNPVENLITVVMYPDSEVPSGKNYPPCALARLIRWGNPVDESRQRVWYLSAENGTIVLLNHVTKPIIDRSNYSIAVGLLPSELSFVFQDYPNADPNDGAIYTKWIAAENFVRKDYEGNVKVDIVDRGSWSLETAKGDAPYRCIATEVHDVWHNGCRWRCLLDKTLLEPRYASQGWAFVEGNPEFTCKIFGAEQTFDADSISQRGDDGNYPVFTTLSVKSYLYNEDVTEYVLPTNVIWTRDSGNANEDNIWAITHAKAGFSVPLTWEDLGKNAAERMVCSFKVTVEIIDETVNVQSSAKVVKSASDEAEF